MPRKPRTGLSRLTRYLRGRRAWVAVLMLAAVGEAADDVSFDRAPLGNGSGRSVDASGGSLFPRVDAPPA